MAPHTQRISITNDDRFVLTSDTTKPQRVVVDTANNQVKARIDLKTMTFARGVDVPESPQEVLVRPDGKVAYVSCMGSDQVAEVDLATWKVSRLIKTGKLTDGLAWAAGK